MESPDGGKVDFQVRKDSGGLRGNCSWEEDLDPSPSSLDQEETGPEKTGDRGPLENRAPNIT